MAVDLRGIYTKSLREFFGDKVLDNVVCVTDKNLESRILSSEERLKGSDDILVLVLHNIKWKYVEIPFEWLHENSDSGDS